MLDVRTRPRTPFSATVVRGDRAMRYARPRTPPRGTTLALGMALCVGLCCGAGPVWSLAPQEILVVANSRSPEGVEAAWQYCAKRYVPESQMVALAMPTSDGVSRSVYESDIEAPLREFFETHPALKLRIRCLVTVYGVPLSIGQYQPTPEEQQVIAGLTERLAQERKALRAELGALCGFAEEIRVKVPGTLAKLGADTCSDTELSGEIRAGRDLVISVTGKVEGPGSRKLPEDRAARFAAIKTRLVGEGGLVDEPADRAPDGEAGDTAAPGASGLLEQYARAAIGTEAREGLYAARRERDGLLGLCAQLLADKATVEKRESEASVDSELALLFWEGHQLYRWLPNLHNPAVRSRVKPPLPPPPLMVARLDGPTPELAAALVDRAIAGESQGLKGKLYIDASSDKRAQGKAYAAYDESLEKLAEGVRTNTTLDVVIDTGPGLFPPGGCPDAALYCGWYQADKYVDSFDWAPGAVGFHISSFAAQGLRSKESEGWCKRMLEEGVAATIGPVSEPYLPAFPLPEHFFRAFLSGRMTLVESYFLTAPFASWRMVLIGDPLYNPFRYHPVMREGEAAEGTPQAQEPK